ncbi:TetR/AcrR family transcriptional regulator [Nonomuraea sp. NPDC050536]|uniref:TetR/AcrR family transcriptional regulator n=1 Tax=Nonomuraea sp. NPDC050536 TaxID=3364366 RepID=UPI0037C63B03
MGKNGTMERKERADAARNRRAILKAAEKLLREHPPEQVSVERVAAAAGVGKGTVFHRFGSRVGLMQALMTERALALQEAIVSGQPPLGPGAAPLERLLAFLDAVVELAARSGGLLTAHEHAQAIRKDSAEPRQSSPIYLFWHEHMTSLLAELRPDADADLIAHLILSSLHNEPIAALLRSGDHERLAACFRGLVTAVAV